MVASGTVRVSDSTSKGRKSGEKAFVLLGGAAGILTTFVSLTDAKCPGDKRDALN